ncbi:DsbA family protein [Arsenophonus endosymbiont of Lipoptena cervi]|uniref:DsbA family protein n=1 Tax=Arsenophonus endosymbiont of Lipoptena cervi TaxID=363258 RepID=UPI00376EDD77
MNKFCLNLIWLFVFYKLSAIGYTEGIEFSQIKNAVQDAPRVVEFFSFYCPHCYNFESIYHVSKMISGKFFKDIKIKLERYHIDFLGPLGSDLTKAWTLAMVLNIEDKIALILFEGIQNKESINTSADIKAVFINMGIKSEEYDAALNSFIVRSLVIKQQKAVKDFQLVGVPAIFVNGKYMIHNKYIIGNDIIYYANAYSDIVKFLINK